MAKIGKGHFRWEDHWGDYDIMYSTKDKGFYIDASKLFAGAGEFFDSLFESDTKTEGILMNKPSWGRNRGLRQIYAPSEKELVESVNKFNMLFVTTSTSEVKVILYDFEYHTETQEKNNHRFYEPNRQKFGMEFQYIIANKKILGINNSYTDIVGNNGVNKYEIKKFKEILWSQELEDFIKLFSKSFDELVNKMKPFFEEDGRIIELIGKNILMP